jgi:hypothetical protein
MPWPEDQTELFFPFATMPEHCTVPLLEAETLQQHMDTFQTKDMNGTECGFERFSHCVIGQEKNIVSLPPDQKPDCDPIFSTWCVFREFCCLKPNGHNNTQALSKPKTGMHLDDN